MIAVDTNVVLRLIVGDDPAQLRAVEDLMQTDPLYLSLPVVMEIEWVLRSRYGRTRSEIADVFNALCALSTIMVERQGWVAWAIERYAERGDFADLIHLVAHADGGLAFATFDESIAAHNGIDAPTSVRLLRSE